MNKVKKIALNFLKDIYDSFMITFLTENALSNLYLDDSNTGVALVAKSHPTLRHPVDRSPPGSSVQGFPRQECWSGHHVHLQGLFWTQRLSPHLLSTEPSGKPHNTAGNCKTCE